MVTHKLDQDHGVWDQMKSSPRISAHQSRITHPKLAVWLILFLSVTYVVYALRAIASSRACLDEPLSGSRRFTSSWSPNATLPSDASVLDRAVQSERKTVVGDIVFGIAASAKLWKQRKNYIKIWYKPKQMRGIVWLDSPVETTPEDAGTLPPIKISGDTALFKYKNRQGDRSALRISRIVSETLRLGLENVRWFVMGDDDTVFITENLVRVLNKYDHRQYYYIGSLSESHLQNIYFSYGMAYGGGGFAISYPLAKALSVMQDKCIQRYPKLYGSDDRIQACMAELGVPLTKEPGFHQYDVYGNLFGLLAAHPVAPLVTMHHLDIVEPIFPNATRVQALQRLNEPTRLDSAALMQQSICYDRTHKWTISVSWGYAVQIFRGIFSPREMETPTRTFLNWYKKADYKAYAFNTRPVSRNPCQKPYVFYLSNVRLDNETGTVSNYHRHSDSHPVCKWVMASPEEVDSVVVRKRPDPHIWEMSPRRSCCRVVESKKKGRMVIDVGVCSEGEFVGM